MVIYYQKSNNVPCVITINGSMVDSLDTYLCVSINNRPSWHEHVEAIWKKLSPGMYCTRIMNKFHVNKYILAMFYNSVTCEVWQCNFLSSGGKIRISDKSTIDTIIKHTSGIIGEVQPLLAMTYQCPLTMKLSKIMQDNDHPLSVILHNAVIPRSGRMRLP